MPYTKEGGWVPAEGEIFRPLSPAEVLEFQEYASENPSPDDVSFCHPVCRQVWGVGIPKMQYPGEQDKADYENNGEADYSERHV